LKKTGQRTKRAELLRFIRRGAEVGGGKHTSIPVTWRDFHDYSNLFQNHAGIDLHTLLSEKISQSSTPVVVTDFGCGKGNALAGLKRIFGPKIKTVGYDARYHSGMRELDEHHVKDLLSATFVKSDVIFSVGTLGYVGEIKKMLDKTAKSLNRNGVALLHFNRIGTKPGNAYDSLLKGAETFFERVSKGEIKINGVSAEVHRFADVPKSDFIVILKKRQ